MYINISAFCWPQLVGWNFISLRLLVHIDGDVLRIVQDMKDPSHYIKLQILFSQKKFLGEWYFFYRENSLISPACYYYGWQHQNDAKYYHFIIKLWHDTQYPRHIKTLLNQNIKGHWEHNKEILFSRMSGGFGNKVNRMLHNQHCFFFKKKNKGKKRIIQFLAKDKTAQLSWKQIKVFPSNIHALYYIQLTSRKWINSSLNSKPGLYNRS